MKMPPVIQPPEMSVVEFLKTAEYGVVACKWIDGTQNREYTIQHFVALLTKPTKKIIKHLAQELNTDPEFSLIGRVGKDIWLQEASPEQVEYYKKQLIT